MSAHYYFALPRLVLRLCRRAAAPSEQSWLEATVAGGLVHAITYLFAARLLLRGFAASQQVLLLLPVLLLVWAWWSLFIYMNALVIKAIRAGGFLRDAADRHVQSIFIGCVTTLFALHLVAAGSWMRLLGLTWIAAVTVNLAAAAVLALIHAERAR